MRHISMILTGVLLSGWMSGCQSTDSSSEPVAIAPLDTRIYEVFGMDCPGCHGGLEKLVKKLEPVHDARADWQAKQLTVFLRPDAVLDDETVYDAIRRANFTPGKRLK